METVFISHASKDASFVEQVLLPLLQKNKINTWYSRDSITTASQWEKTIQAGLEASTSFLAVLTPHALASRWVKAEVDWWLEEREGKTFVPVIAEKCDWKSLHLLIRNYQAVDFSSGEYDAKRRLLPVWGITGPSQQGLIRSVYASYAAKDRVEVLKWTTGAELGGIDVFFDKLPVGGAGKHWQAQIEEEIASRDLLCLFWSEAARQSKWVEKEWRFALELRGLEFIRPVPLVSPVEVPPPPELMELHFQDWKLAYMGGAWERRQ